MSMNAYRTICAIAALLSALWLTPAVTPIETAHAQAAHRAAPIRRGRPATRARPREAPSQPPLAELRPKPLPPRVPFSAADDAAAQIPGIPDARFFADSVADFNKALPPKPGPWLILSSGGEDGAFGAGFLNGLTASGKRPDYSVVTGVSTGALMAPFAFAGSHYDDALRDAYTKINAAEQITPALLADIAARYRAGRRLFVITTDLDSERSVVWNMGAIAAHGGKEALNLFRTVLLASSSIPGAFPPVLIGVEGNGKRFAEMNVDGGIGGQFFVAPAPLLAAASDYRLPATQLTIVVNSGLQPEFQVVQQNVPAIAAQSVDMAVKGDTRLMLDRVYLAARRSGVGFNVAAIPQNFSAPSRGPFDPDFMGALYRTGFELGKSATPFRAAPPAYPGPPSPHAQDPKGSE
jgi:predicted acylesterase/phospholipase RssA